MKSVTTYLLFNGNCRQAMTFYNQCLGTDLQISPFPETEGKPSTDPNAGIMHARLTRGGAPILMASDDCQPGKSLQPANNFSISIDCDSLVELERLFDALSQDGQVRLPLSEMFWGARFGMLTDQFGIQWMLNYDLSQQRS
jgi:PhnB protein